MKRLFVWILISLFSISLSSVAYSGTSSKYVHPKEIKGLSERLGQLKTQLTIGDKKAFVYTYNNDTEITIVVNNENQQLVDMMGISFKKPVGFDIATELTYKILGDPGPLKRTSNNNYEYYNPTLKAMELGTQTYMVFQPYNIIYTSFSNGYTGFVTITFNWI